METSTDTLLSANRLALIGNLENRRIQQFCEACEELGYPEPTCLAYEEILDDPRVLGSLAEHTVRLDSPGENQRLSNRLIALGGGPKDANLEFGEIAFSKEYHLGYCEVLQWIETSGLNCMNSPSEISVMFDKWASHERFLEQSVARPPSQMAQFDFANFRNQAPRSGQVFLKPLHGSSASGVCAFRWSGSKMILFSPLKIVKGKLFNDLRVTRYENELEIKFILDNLLPQGMIMEHWIPKLSLPKGAVDVRVLVISGEARHRVVRQSVHPMTNLHLGNQRGDERELINTLGPEKWRAVLLLAEQAAACFPNSLSVGVDILIDVSGRCFVLEVNAFGDLLPRLKDRGQTTYEALAQELCA